MSYDQNDGDGFGKNSSTGSNAVKQPISELRDQSKFGDCYIFDYQRYDDYQNFSTRYGSDKDVERLKKDFEELNFNVFSNYRNSTKEATLNALKEASKQDYKNSKCFVCCFLTHGEEGRLAMRDTYKNKPDTYLNEEDILKWFSRSACENLKGIPKIFIFQACRGKKREEGFEVVKGGDKTDNTSVKELVSVPEIPDYLDTLLVYSTYAGHVAYKDAKGDHGSFFIDELCRTLEQFSGNSDLLQILTIVNFRIARLFQSRTENKKQMPGFTSRLTSKVKFNKEIPPYKTSDTKFFDERRNNSPLGKQSNKEPEKDKLTYEIKKLNRIKFLLLLNMDNKIGKDSLLDSASSLWCSVINRGYQTEALSNWSGDELTDFLKEAKYFSSTDCSICFIACQAEGDSLCDADGKKLLKQDVINQFTGDVCPVLIGKPKIFIFLMSSQTNSTCNPYDYHDGTDGDHNNTVPVHSDLLEVAITVQGSKQFKDVIEKFCSIFEKENSEDFLSQLTSMFKELSNKNVATFYLNSTLTKLLLLKESKGTGK